ncbi:hypothetical protein C3B44_07045 [Corynebacterium yudongzhengii]|uniref:Uncharacterized protein n=1 Tax=Corynebacterium yudongzhengii TaxID=2080740 RepID=A0A2U1T9I3_9CORY|nr:hypothetical protein [Corynebacterium yudongzhengii]AWB82145.1 hypothetical protein C3B44_07045 [Corynebacterium yudongzhengii]PWC02649.1 hypothetical protein DF222_01515 [Corynebacterium yudongzhengii]
MHKINHARTTAHRTRSNLNPGQLADRIAQRHHDVLGTLYTMLRHPRSLARTSAAWRPITLGLPAVSGYPELSASVTRHRVGPRARARALGYGGRSEPAYVIAIRITDPAGGRVDPTLSEAWLRALVGELHIECVHELGDGHTLTFVWLADAHYQPVPSPSSLFAGFSDAA